MSAVAITNRDRFHFSLFLALSLHAALILGIGFSADLNAPESTSIEVTISLSNDKIAPDEADFLAAQNQLGSGTLASVKEMTTTERADFHTETFTPVYSSPTPTIEQRTSSETLVSTTAQSLSTTPTEQLDISDETNAPTQNLQREQLIQEIASLEARIAQNQQALANRPRIKHLSQVTTRSAAEAAYLNMWRQKCERIGRVNYPPGQLEGEVLMLVSILSNGHLDAVKVLKSSGYNALDKAALATVRQAAPFQPFTVDMRKEYEVLEFTRTWQFTKTGSSLVRGG